MVRYLGILYPMIAISNSGYCPKARDGRLVTPIKTNKPLIKKMKINPRNKCSLVYSWSVHVEHILKQLSTSGSVNYSLGLRRIIAKYTKGVVEWDECVIPHTTNHRHPHRDRLLRVRGLQLDSGQYHTTVPSFTDNRSVLSETESMYLFLCVKPSKKNVFSMLSMYFPLFRKSIFGIIKMFECTLLGRKVDLIIHFNLTYIIK